MWAVGLCGCGLGLGLGLAGCGGAIYARAPDWHAFPQVLYGMSPDALSKFPAMSVLKID